MKILYYSTAIHASHGGSIQSILFYKELQANSKVDSVLLYPSKGASNSFGAGGAKNIFRNWLRKIGLLQIVFFFRRNQFYIKGLFLFIEKENPDAIVIQLDSSFLQVKYLKKKFPKLIITTQVNASPFDEPFKNIAFKRFFQRLETKCLAFADKNFFVSENLRSRIMGSYISERRDHVFHNGVDINHFRPMNEKEGLRKSFNIPLNAFVLGYVGTIDQHKRLDILINAFHQLSVQYTKLRLIIIGDGPELNKMKILVDSLELNERIEFKGWVKHQEIPQWLNTFDVAIHHHANDYMSPLKIFEYMAVGLPVIGPDIPAVKEVFKDTEHLLLTKKMDSDSLCLQIQSLMNDTSLKNTIARNGFEYVTNFFTWEKYTSNIVEGIEESIKQRL